MNAEPLVDVILAIAFLLLGLVVAFYRAHNAETLAFKLQQQLEHLEERLKQIEASLEYRPSGDDRPTQTAAPDVPAAAVVADVSTLSPLPDPAVPAPSAAAPGRRVPDIEAIIGGRWLLFAGVAAVVLGMSYFIKFAFDNGWISEPLRVGAGVATGLLLIAGGMRFWSRNLVLFGHALAGAGIIVLYVSIYAALHFYALIPPSAAFALMVLVTAGAVYLSDRQGSQPLAALGLLGGFATPLLVGGDRDAQIVLFTYMGILITGAATLARRHTWPLLGAVSYLCTFVLVVTWFFSSYRSDRWLTTELFLTLYAVLFTYLLWTVLRPGAGTRQAQLAAATLATAPLAYHLASLILLNGHPAAWLLYVLLFTVAGLVADRRLPGGWVRLPLLLIVGLPMTLWLDGLQYPRWYGPAVTTLLALYVLHLASTWTDPASERAPVFAATAAHTQLNGLIFAFALYLFLESRAAAWSSWMVAALAVWNAALAWIARQAAPHLRLQFVVLSGTFAATAIVLAFDGPAVAFGWAAEGVLVGWLAARERRLSLALGSAVLISLGAVHLASLLAAPLPVGETPAINPRALATTLAIAMLAWLAWHLREDPLPEVRKQARTSVVILANLLALGVISAELHAYFAQRALDASLDGELRGVADAGLMEQVSLSVTWALYAVGLVFVGIRRRFPPARYLAIGLFGVVVGKILLHDIAGLDRVYRMLSVLGVGVLLLVASYLYQRMAVERESPQ